MLTLRKGQELRDVDAACSINVESIGKVARRVLVTKVTWSAPSNGEESLVNLVE